MFLFLILIGGFLLLGVFFTLIIFGSMVGFNIDRLNEQTNNNRE